MAITHLFNSRGQWIAFRLSNKLFDTEGHWVGWFPSDEGNAFMTQGQYIGTLTENRLYYFSTQALRVCPDYLGEPGYRVYPDYPGIRAYSPLPPGAEDVTMPETGSGLTMRYT